MKDQKRQLKILFNHSRVIKQIPYFNDSIQAKIVGFFIRKKAYRNALLFFKIKEFMRNKCRRVFLLLQRMNKR